VPLDDAELSSAEVDGALLGSTVVPAGRCTDGELTGLGPVVRPAPNRAPPTAGLAGADGVAATPRNSEPFDASERVPVDGWLVEIGRPRTIAVTVVVELVVEITRVVAGDALVVGVVGLGVTGTGVGDGDAAGAGD